VAKILLVEDSELVREAVAAILEQEGHILTIAENGEEGLAKLQSTAFDLVIADLWMPKMDGLAMLKKSRALGDMPPVIVLSGGGPQAPLELSASLADANGAVAVLFKPCEDEELLSAVNKALL